MNHIIPIKNMSKTHVQRRRTAGQIIKSAATSLGKGLLRLATSLGKGFLRLMGYLARAVFYLAVLYLALLVFVLALCSAPAAVWIAGGVLAVLAAPVGLWMALVAALAALA